MTEVNIRSFAPKDPQEVDYWEIDFTDRMPTGDSIASIVTVFLATGDAINDDAAMVIDQFAFAGKSVSGRWANGTGDTTYRITARVVTVQGRTLDKSGDVLVIDL